MKVFVVVVLLFTVCSAASIHDKEDSSESTKHNEEDNSSSSEHEDVARYTFDWSVRDEESKLDFGHQETRDGDLTTGLYRVLLPNSVIQTVNYTVNGYSGFVAEVHNEEVKVSEGDGKGEGEVEGKAEEKSYEKQEHVMHEHSETKKSYH